MKHKSPFRKNIYGVFHYTLLMCVICMDDDVRILTVMKKMLRVIGFENIYEINNGNDILDLIYDLTNSKKKITMIFLDACISQNGDGIKYAKLIKHIDPSIPIILITGYSKEFFKENLYFFDGYLQKPFDLHTLQTMCASFIQ